MSSPHTHHDHHQHAGVEALQQAGDGGAKIVAAAGSSHSEHAGHDHGAMVADFRRRFWVTLVLTPPVLLLSPMIRHYLGLTDVLSFRGDGLVLFALSTIAYLYGGWPFLTGFFSELGRLFLLGGGDLWLPRRSVLLGARHPHCHHAARPLG